MINYEDIKKLADSQMEVENEYYVSSEFKMAQNLLPGLKMRSWLLVRALPDAGLFITTDRPVVLTWENPDSVPLLFRANPGFGFKNTKVFFAISKKFALIGSLDGKQEVKINDADRQSVASINTAILMSTNTQLYAASIDFPCLNKNLEVITGRALFSNILGIPAE